MLDGDVFVLDGASVIVGFLQDGGRVGGVSNVAGLAIDARYVDEAVFEFASQKGWISTDCVYGRLRARMAR